MAILVHYFSLAGLVWILLEAVMLYIKLVAVYGGEFVRIRKFLLFGWGRFYMLFKFSKLRIYLQLLYAKEGLRR